MKACIELKDVSYAYPLTESAAVRHLNCHLEKGKCYGLIGPNASGKTTLCNIMRGLCPSFYEGTIKGSVVIDNKDISQWDESELSLKISYVFQDPFAQISGIKETVFEEIGMGMENLGIKLEDMLERIQEISKIVKVDHLLQKNPLALSGGQCQRVAFASVLALDADIIVIDEPTSQLDPEGTNDVFEIVDRLKKMGKTILIAEHKIDLLAEYCDEIIAMTNGEILIQGTTREVFSDPRLPENGVQIPQVVHLAAKLEQAGKPLQNIPLNQAEAVALLKKKRGINSYGN